MAFIFDVVGGKAHRRGAVPASCCGWVRCFAQQLGSHALGLNVFGCDLAARSLYQCLG
jgi:hypothetical protein